MHVHYHNRVPECLASYTVGHTVLLASPRQQYEQDGARLLGQAEAEAREERGQRGLHGHGRLGHPHAVPAARGKRLVAPHLHTHIASRHKVLNQDLTSVQQPRTNRSSCSNVRAWDLPKGVNYNLGQVRAGSTYITTSKLRRYALIVVLRADVWAISVLHA